MAMLLVGVAIVLCPTLAAAGPAPVNLGAAANFGILAGSAVTVVGGGTNNGNVGLSPAAGSFITGLTTNQVNGTLYAVDGSGPLGSVIAPDLLSTAKTDLATAYADAASRVVDSTVATELGGSTRNPGVYDSATGTFELTGVLNLDAGGDPDGVFIFKMASTLVTASFSQVNLTGGARSGNVFWQVGSFATLGTYSVFCGTVMAQASITMNTGTTLDGRALAQNAAVTFDTVVGGLTILSVSVAPATWTVGTVGTGTVQMSSSGSRIAVTNDGNVAETFTFGLSDEDDLNEWTHSPSKNGAGDQVYVLSALCCGEGDSPGVDHFNQTASDDVLTPSVQDATDAYFAYAGGTASGVAVPARTGRALWLRLDTPTAGAGGIAHTITIRVGCFQP